MKWSIALGRLAGIPVYLHTTFALLLIWVGFMHWNAGRNLGDVVSGIVFILALFGCVLLHELGHALAARRYGIPTRDITLLPIGGVARLERMPERPSQELWVALAGPAVNVLIAAGLLVWLIATRTFEPLNSLGVASGSFAERLMVVNVFLVVFNMVPAFPMDGGRVLRALMALKYDYVRSTRIAAWIGQGMAVLFGVAGLLWNPFLVLIAAFVWFGAAQESTAVQLRAALGRARVEQAMGTRFRSLDAGDVVGHAARLAITGFQSHFPVLERGHLVALLSGDHLLKALSGDGASTPIWQVAEPVEVTFHPGDSLDSAFRRLQTSRIPVAPVLQDGAMVGLLTLDNILTYIRIREAMKDGGSDADKQRRPLFPAIETR